MDNLFILIPLLLIYIVSNIFWYKTGKDVGLDKSRNEVYNPLVALSNNIPNLLEGYKKTTIKDEKSKHEASGKESGSGTNKGH